MFIDFLFVHTEKSNCVHALSENQNNSKETADHELQNIDLKLFILIIYRFNLRSYALR